MDLLTQGLLGAALAQTAAPTHEVRRATGIGFFAGLLADADILIRSASDPLLNLEFHRHFTHSLFFIPFGALLASLLLWPFLRKRLGFVKIYLYALLGFSLSGFLDACTSYGTLLLWPLSSERIAFNIISIIDPVFTCTLILGLLIAWRGQKPSAARIALTVAGLYLILGFVQQQRATAVVEDLIATRGHQAERILVKPTLGNILLWRSLYEHKGKIYVDAVRVGLPDRTAIHAGGDVTLVKGLQDVAAGSVLEADFKRFAGFSDGWLAFAPDRTEMLGDMRYSMLPDGVQPLWGIEFDPKQSQQHARYVVYRELSEGQRRRFMQMLFGQDN